MINRFVIFGACVFFGAALLAPGLTVTTTAETDADAGADAARTSPTANPANMADSEWYSGGHSLERHPDGHFYADGAVQGASIRFLVDTGASVIALTGEDAMAAGLSWDDSEVRPIGTGASGAVYGVPAIIGVIEIGGITRRNVQAVIIPDGLDTSLLGQSFLSQVKSVEIAQNRMILEDL